MTGKTHLAGNNESTRLDNLRDILKYCKGFPHFVDEINAASFTRITSLIKDESACEKVNPESMPVIVMAGNDLKEPDEKVRKRMVFSELTLLYQVLLIKMDFVLQAIQSSVE